MSRPLLVVLALVGAGFGWALLESGPLPGDVASTRSVQRLFGAEPAWSAWLTDIARFPAVWATLAVAAGLAAALRGWRAAMAAGVAFALAQGLDRLLRRLIDAPRPDPDLVAVASPAASSGLPSTAGLVFGALFGLTLLASRGRRDGLARAIAALSAGLLAAGFLARVVLGGHWPSQMLLSLALGALAGALALRLADVRPAKRRRG